MYDDVPDRSMKAKTLLMTLAIVGCLLLAAGILFAVKWGASRDWTRPPADRSATGEPPQTVTWHGMHGGEPATPEEKRVAEYIQKYRAPTNLSWLEWGPHDLDQRTGFAEKGTIVLRVRYVCERTGTPRTTYDTLFTFDPKITENEPVLFHVGSQTNPDGGKWLEVATAKKEAAETEAMKGPHR